MIQQKYHFFIGIDISKKWLDASVSKDGEKGKMLHLKVDQTAAGYKALYSWICKWAKVKKIDGRFLFCMEHTGVYTYPFCQYLEQKKLSYVLVSGLEIKYSMGIRRGKSDKSDSKDIAVYAYRNQNELRQSSLPTVHLIQLKHLLAYRDRLVKCKKGLGVSAGELSEFASKEEVNLIVKDSDQVTKLMAKKIKAVEAQMRSTIRQSDGLERLYILVTSVKSVGLIVGVTLLVYTRAFEAFPNVRKFACYCGIAPFEQSSGSSMKKAASVHPLGYRKIKALLSNSARNSVNYDAELRAYYQRKMEEGKHDGVVINAIKFKILSRVFAVVKRGTPFVDRYTFKA